MDLDWIKSAADAVRQANALAESPAPTEEEVDALLVRLSGLAHTHGLPDYMAAAPRGLVEVCEALGYLMALAWDLENRRLDAEAEP